jgi:hypothetical protein
MEDGDWQVALTIIDAVDEARLSCGLDLNYDDSYRVEALIGLNRFAEARIVHDDYLARNEGRPVTELYTESPNRFIDAFVRAVNNDLSNEEASAIMKQVCEHRKIDPEMFPVKTQLDGIAAVRLARADACSRSLGKKAVREARAVLALFPNHPMAAYLAARNLNDLRQEPQEERRMWTLAASLPGPWGDQARQAVKAYEARDRIAARKASQANRN